MRAFRISRLAAVAVVPLFAFFSLYPVLSGQAVASPPGGAWAALELDEAFDARDICRRLEEAGISGWVSESSEHILIDDFGGLRALPLDRYESEGPLDFDPRNDGYAEQMRAFFLNGGKRRVFIPVAGNGWSLEQRTAAVLDMPFSFSWLSASTPAPAPAAPLRLLPLCAAALVLTLFLVFAGWKGPSRADILISLALLPPFCAAGLSGGGGFALAGLLYAFAFHWAGFWRLFGLRQDRKRRFSAHVKEYMRSGAAWLLLPALLVTSVLAAFFCETPLFPSAAAILAALVIPALFVRAGAASLPPVSWRVEAPPASRGGRFAPVPILDEQTLPLLLRAFAKASVPVSGGAAGQSFDTPDSAPAFRPMYGRRRAGMYFPKTLVPWALAQAAAFVISLIGLPAVQEPAAQGPVAGMEPPPGRAEWEAHYRFQREFSFRPLFPDGGAQAVTRRYGRYVPDSSGLIVAEEGGDAVPDREAPWTPAALFELADFIEGRTRAGQEGAAPEHIFPARVPDALCALALMILAILAFVDGDAGTGDMADSALSGRKKRKAAA